MAKVKIIEAVDKKAKVSRILKVQEIIDFFVLGEIQDQPRYVRQLEERMIDTLKQGVNLSYMTRRIDFMHGKGYLGRFWDDDYKRYNHYCRISDDGMNYFKKMLGSLPYKIKEAVSFYQALQTYAAQFGEYELLKQPEKVPRKKEPAKISRILKVEELIDFFVLAEIQVQPRYVRELDKRMVSSLNRVGVNVSYMSRRIKSLHLEGYLERYWDDEDKHYNYYCKITDKGMDLFRTRTLALQPKVHEAIGFYQALDKYVMKFGKIDLIL